MQGTGSEVCEHTGTGGRMVERRAQMLKRYKVSHGNGEVYR